MLRNCVLHHCLKKGLLFFSALTFLAFAGQASAGSNANATVTIDLITDGGAGNQTDEGVHSGVVAGQGTKIAVEVFAKGVTTSLIGVKIEFDFKSEELKLDKVENSAFLFALPEATGVNFAAIAPVTLPESGFIGRAEFSTVTDVRDMEFYLGIKAVTLAEESSASIDVIAPEIIAMMSTINFNVKPKLQTDAGLLPELPTPQGGEIVGSWVAEKVELNAYVPAALAEAVKPLTVEGETNGTITIGSDGSIQADYITVTNVSAVLLVPLTVAVHDTSQYTGNYTVASDTHTLTITRENEDPLNYTYTATADSLHIIRPLLLDELLASLSDAVRPLAMGVLSQYVPPDDPIKIVITFAKAADTGTPSMLTGDFDGDGRIGISDFLLFVEVFGTQIGQENFEPKFDLDSDGTVGISDFLIFLNSFGKTANG